MSYGAVEWALEVRVAGGLSPATRLVLLHIARHWSADKGSFPATKTIARRTDLTERYVNQRIDQLLELKLASVIGHRPTGRVFDIAYGSGVPLEDGTIVPDDGTMVPSLGTGVPSERNYSSIAYNEESVRESVIESVINPEPSGLDLPEGNHEVEDMSTVTEILSDLPFIETVEQAQALLVSKVDDKGRPGAKALWEYWRDLYALFHPGAHVAAGTLANQSMLLKAYTQAGPEFVSALAIVIEHWVLFCKYIERTANGKSTSLPSVSVVLRHAAAVVSFAKLEQAAPPVVHPGAIAPNPALTKPAISQDTVEQTEEVFDREEARRFAEEYDRDNGNV